MSTAGMLKMTTISMEEKPIAMAPLNSCSTMNPSMDKSNPRSGETITASPMILMTTTMVAISTLPSVTIDRILTYGTLLDVLWQMYHAWITYGTVRRIV